MAYGLFFKVLNLVPRHRTIVAAVLGDEVAAPITVAIGLGEVLMALWILSGYRPRLCILLQSVAIVGMNSLELVFAQDHLLAPLPMLAANGILLAVGWWAALRAGRPARPVPP